MKILIRVFFPIFVMTMTFFSCSQELGKEPPAVTIGDSLPENYQHRVMLAPINGLEFVDKLDNPLFPKIVSNRLVLFLENDSVDIRQFVKEFKKTYSGNEYRVISYNTDLNSIEIVVPEEQRDSIKETISSKFSNFEPIAFYETIVRAYETKLDTSSFKNFHDIIQLQEAWNITRGSEKITVAVVDNGFDLSHNAFNGKIIKPYNIFTGDGKVYCDGELGKHGTHVAVTAIGKDSTNIGGVAPLCKLMPIQVFDGEFTTNYAIMNGIMHAVKNGADVVNVSAEPIFENLSHVDVEIQREFSKRYLKNEEKMWIKLFSKAREKNSIVVLSAGNDHVLSSVPAQNRSGNAIVVCACDSSNSAISFSNFADCSTISAPGFKILGTFPNNKSAYISGTSMAAPVVSGVIALMKSIKSDMQLGNITYVLEHTCTPQKGDIPGCVNANKAVQAVKKGKIRPTISKKHILKSIKTKDGDKILFYNNNGLLFVRSEKNSNDIQINGWVVYPGEFGGWAVAPSKEHYCGDIEDCIVSDDEKKVLFMISWGSGIGSGTFFTSGILDLESGHITSGVASIMRNVGYKYINGVKCVVFRCSDNEPFLTNPCCNADDGAWWYTCYDCNFEKQFDFMNPRSFRYRNDLGNIKILGSFDKSGALDGCLVLGEEKRKLGGGLEFKENKISGGVDNPNHDIFADFQICRYEFDFSSGILTVGDRYAILNKY